MSDSAKNSRPSPPEDSENKGITLLQLISSTLFAALGIQKRSNMERDFSKGKPAQFIVAGILFTAIFVLVVVLVVNLVLGSVQN